MDTLNWHEKRSTQCSVLGKRTTHQIDDNVMGERCNIKTEPIDMVLPQLDKIKSDPEELQSYIKMEDPIEIWSDFSVETETNQRVIMSTDRVLKEQTKNLTQTKKFDENNMEAGDHIQHAIDQHDKHDSKRQKLLRTKKPHKRKSSVRKSKQNTIECDECGKKFTDKASIYRHKRIHAGVRPYECDYDKCNKRFTRKHHLLQHTRVHTGEKPFACDKCQQTFSQIAHLNDHMKIHADRKKAIKAHQCKECKRSFLRKSDMTRHIRTHTREKLHSCTDCQRKFTRKSSLNIHIRIHSENKSDDDDR